MSFFVEKNKDFVLLFSGFNKVNKKWIKAYPNLYSIRSK